MPNDAIRPPDLFDGHRDGETYEAQFDLERLNRQARAVFDVMADGKWHTLRDIAMNIDEPEASISARLRDFRKERFGAFTVERKRHEFKAGLFLYRVVMPRVGP